MIWSSHLHWLVSGPIHRALANHCSQVLDICSTALQLTAGEYGAGRHIWYLSESDLAKASLLGTVGVPFGQFAMCIPKIAAIGVLIRIAGPTATKKVKIYLYSMTAILVILSTLYSIFLFAQCTPAFALWTQVPDSTCWNPHVIAYTGAATAVFSAFVDLNVAIYPIFILRKLQMDTRKKVGICFLMSLGATATICAACKIPHLQDQTTKDITWAVIPLSCWTMAEVNVVMIAASVPMLRPFWLWARGKPYQRNASGGSSGRNQSRRGFVPFGSRKDTRNEMTIDVGLEETTAPRESHARALLTPPAKGMPVGRFGAHGGITVEKSVTVTHEEV